MKPNILLTNDDGYRSIGFYPLLSELSREYSVTAVVPSGQRSWIGKSITAHNDVTIDKHRIHDHTIYICSGTPADCVQIGLYDILKSKPVCVISGINIGVNIGHGRILSSGTVGATMEAAIDGVFAISSSYHIPAESLNVDFFDQKNYTIFTHAADITHKFIHMVLGKQLPNDIDLLTLNIPYEATMDTAIRITKPFKQPYGQLFHKTKARVYGHTNPTADLHEYGISEEGSDLDALLEGKISVTPINLELSSQRSIQEMHKLLIPDW